jgi:hypothetical protein
LDIRFKRGFEQVSGDYAILEALRYKVTIGDTPSRDVNPFLHCCWRIRDAMPQAISIDNFLDCHNEDKSIELCGKLAIVRTILEAEANSLLFVDPMKQGRHLPFDQLENTWFNSFMQLLTENCRRPDLDRRLGSIVLIIFNYDRCIEHYLYHALQNYYSISPTEAALLLKSLEIYHPYGTVGSLPWDSQVHTIEFGCKPHSKQLLELANQIKTFTEGTDESSSAINAIRLHMEKSRKIVFLGFAFHRLNIDLLLSTAKSPKRQTDRHIFATALNISRSDSQSISVELSARAAIHQGNIQIRNDLTCRQLFHEYWRSLSLL